MTIPQLRAQYPGYWITGTGMFSVVCSSARRITLCRTLEAGQEQKYASCGRGCDRYTSPHIGYKLTAEPAPKRKIELGYRD